MKEKWFGLVLTVILILIMVVSPALAQGTPPSKVKVQIVLLTKTNGETEVNYYLRWVETAPRDRIEMILDCWGGDLGYGDVTVYSENNRVFDLREDEDHGKATESGAYHKHVLIFPEVTRVGGDYELAIGYGSRLITNPDGPGTFNWTANPWPFPVERYEIDWVGQGVSYNYQVKGEFSNYEVDSFDSTTKYKNFSRSLAVRLVKYNAPAGFIPSIIFSYGASSVQPTAPKNQPTTKPVATPKPVVATPKPTPSDRGGSVCGSLFVLLILACVIGGCVIILIWASKRRRKSSYTEPTPSSRPSTDYVPPKVKRETTRSSGPNIVTDLTMAEVAYLMGSPNAKIILSCVRDLEKRGIIVVVEKDPLKLMVRPVELEKAVKAGTITAVDTAVIEAVTNDGVIDVNETEVIVARVRASAEMKIAERNADRQSTRDYYEERIRQLELEVRRQKQPVVYVEDHDDFWFWLWLNEHYHHDHDPRPGTYRYPTPKGTIFVDSDGSRRPLTDDTFRQTKAYFERPKKGLAAEITEAAARAARKITGAAAGEEPVPPPKPHDACVVKTDCVSRPHSACVHDACVHDACVTPHSACVSRPHSACVHSACVHSACVSHSAHSAHSACVSRAR